MPDNAQLYLTMIEDLVTKALTHAVGNILQKRNLPKPKEKATRQTCAQREVTSRDNLRLTGVHRFSSLIHELWHRFTRNGHQFFLPLRIHQLDVVDFTIQFDAESVRSFHSQQVFFDVIAEGGLKHYIGQLGHSTVFSLYTSVCGVILSLSDCTVSFKWDTLHHYLSDEYHHHDIISSFTNQKSLCIVKVIIQLSEAELDSDFESRESKASVECFSKLVCKVVPTPRFGEQLMCYVKGDEYVTGKLKHYFIQPVFRRAGVILGSRRHDDLQMRLDSCRRLQDGFDASIDAFSLQLAEAGYYLTTDKNLAQCYECGGILQLKNFDFDVWRDHAYWHPSCPYLLEKKGHQFVEDVRRELRRKCDFGRECIFTFKIRALAAAQPVYPSNNHVDDDDMSDDDDDDSEGWQDFSSNYSSDSGFDYDDNFEF